MSTYFVSRSTLDYPSRKTNPPPSPRQYRHQSKKPPLCYARALPKHPLSVLPQPLPARWVGYDSSAFSVAKAAVLLAMLKREDRPLEVVVADALQVGYFALTHAQYSMYFVCIYIYIYIYICICIYVHVYLYLCI